MGHIAEDLFLLLLDNASAQPSLDRPRRDHVLGAAVLLDLAHTGHVRPAVPGDPVPDGRLVALASATPLDPVTRPGRELLAARALRPDTAIKKLGRHSEDRLITHLEQLGHIRRVDTGSALRRGHTLPLTTRDRVGPARTAVLSALFDRTPPAPVTAAVITLLHAVDGLGTLLSLNDRGWRWVHARAGEIAGGSWVDESPTTVAEVNLAVTAAAVRQALARLT
ncbi:GPP34 family phosphoprotein [Mycolicibacterium sp. 3033]|nr:GPP34 family phosphoprotein [Mycolicibacterium aurantiacum]